MYFGAFVELFSFRFNILDKSLNVHRTIFHNRISNCTSFLRGYRCLFITFFVWFYLLFIFLIFASLFLILSFKFNQIFSNSLFIEIWNLHIVIFYTYSIILLLLNLNPNLKAYTNFMMASDTSNTFTKRCIKQSTS